MKYNEWNKTIGSMKIDAFSSVEEYLKLEKHKDLDLNIQTQTELSDFLKENKKALGIRGRKWTFTIHNPFKYLENVEELSQRFEPKLDKGSVKKLIYSLEVGKSGETLHLQGYIEYKTASATKSSLLKSFGFKDVHLERAKGTVKENVRYMRKKEAHVKGKKFIFENGISAEDMRDNMNINDFVDYLIETDQRYSAKLADDKCLAFRNDPNGTPRKIATLYNLRKPMRKNSRLPVITFSGNSGSGKSLISKWFIKSMGYDFKDHVAKQEANGEVKQIWFKHNDSLRPVCYFSEINYYFPHKTNLLSLIDGESELATKGGFIRNNFEALILNTTAMTPHFIYGITQTAEAYIEITRRLEMDDSQFFVFPNPEWSKLSVEDRNNINCDIHPPLLFKMTEAPDKVRSFNLKDNRKESPMKLKVINDNLIELHYESNEKDYLGKIIYSPEVQKIKVEPVSKEFIVKHFKSKMF